MKITAALVKQLLQEQFPQWADLPVTAVLPGGHDNRTFRLGTQLSVRLPSHKRYEAQVQKEAAWLPFLAEHLSVPVTVPVAIGRANARYPLAWSVNRWLPGDIALASSDGLERLASELAKFLHQLWQIPAASGPTAGTHNFHRGGNLEVYDQETRQALLDLGLRVDPKLCGELWDRALASRWSRDPVWVHGDVAPGNLLVEQGRLIGVIDFGSMGVGDPACDLVMAWTHFDKTSRQQFMNAVDVDQDTWDRARGWALWKALITFDRAESQGVVAELANEAGVSFSR